jgi:hypothetical protein
MLADQTSQLPVGEITWLKCSHFWRFWPACPPGEAPAYEDSPDSAESNATNVWRNSLSRLSPKYFANAFHFERVGSSRATLGDLAA